MNFNNFLNWFLIFFTGLVICLVSYKLGSIDGYMYGQIDYSKGLIKWKLENQPQQWMFYKEGYRNETKH